MPTIHLPGDGHTTPVPDPDGTTWDAYTDDKILATLKAALFILKHNIRNMRPCNDCFKRLPGGRTFQEVFDDATVFISFDPSGPDSGATDSVGGKEITVGASEFKVGRWSVAASGRSPTRFRATGVGERSVLRATERKGESQCGA